jgi:hypothetical protein
MHGKMFYSRKLHILKLQVRLDQTEFQMQINQKP